MHYKPQQLHEDVCNDVYVKFIFIVSVQRIMHSDDSETVLQLTNWSFEI